MQLDEKIKFIRQELVPSFRELNPEHGGNWGKMSAWQMVEHVSDFFDVSSGKIIFDIVTPVDQLPAYKAFLLSNKEFRENTKAPVSVIGEEPAPVRSDNYSIALDALQRSIDNFFSFFEIDPLQTTIHPVFGSLNFEEWIILHYKHVTHHQRQFAKNNAV